MSIRENFSDSISFPVTNEFEKGAVTQILTALLGTFPMFLLEASSKTGIFRQLSGYVFGVRNFQNTKSLSVRFLIKNCKN